jgi:phosphotriesterase-related protein
MDPTPEQDTSMTDAGKVITVLGPVEPTNLGPTLMHEHVFVDISCYFVAPDEASLKKYINAPVEISMLGYLRRRPTSFTLDNVILSDESAAIEELRRFKYEGGSALVDCTVVGIGRDPRALRRVARTTDLHIIQGTGIYTESAHPSWVAKRSIDELASMFVKDITVGIGDTGVRAGLLGEIGTSGVEKGAPRGLRVGDMTSEEEKVLRAAARASRTTGAAVSLHLDRRGQGALKVIEILSEEGLAPDRMIMGHMDTRSDIDYHLAVVRAGAFIQYDTFGREGYSEETGVAWPSDFRRIEYLCELLKAGFEDQVLLSQDVCLKIDLRKYGGNGYDHILVSILPMFRRAGITEAQIHKMLVSNPRRALALKAV